MAREWYLVQVFSGDECKIKEVIESKSREKRLDDRIRRVVVPIERSREEKNGRLVDKRRKQFPGLVAVEIDCLTPEIARFMLQLPGVQSFSSGNSKPQPVRRSEVPALFQGVVRLPEPEEFQLQIGQVVRLKEGPMEGLSGPVTKIDGEKVWISADFFGAARTVETQIGALELV